MTSERDRARNIAEEGLDKSSKATSKKGVRMIGEAKKRDRNALEDLAQEVERDREQAEHFVKEG